MTLNSRIEIITPERANELLTRNTKNRALNLRTVKKLADQMEKGLWRLTHQGIAIGETGELLDGQHRLAAVVLSGVAVPMMIFDSLSDDCIRVIDTGNRRSPGDAFKILGVEDYARISAGTRVYYNYLNHPEIVWTGLTSKNITNDELFLFYEMDVGKERADAAAKLAREAYRGWSYLNQSVVFALILILDDANFHYDTSHSVMSFLGDLALGENLQSGDPVLAYRRQAMNRTGRRAHSSKWQQVLLNSFIKLWNSRQKFKQDGKPVMRFLEPQDTPMQTVNPS